MILINKNELRTNKFSEGIYGSFSLLNEDDAALYSSIDNEGILEPIVITKTNLVLSGNRRLKVALSLTTIKEVPVVYSDLDENEFDEYTFLQFNQQRNKNIIQIAREYELIRQRYKTKQGVKDEQRVLAKEQAHKTLLDDNDITSDTTIKRVLKSKRLKTELERNFNQDNNWTDDDSWLWLLHQHTIRKKEVNTIMKHLEDSKNEWKNYEASKSVEIFDKDRIHLIHGDSSDLSKYLDDEQVDCIPNSPPYFGAVRTYLQDGQKVKSSKKKILEYFESLIFEMASLNPKSKLSQTK